LPVRSANARAGSEKMTRKSRVFSCLMPVSMVGVEKAGGKSHPSSLVHNGCVVVFVYKYTFTLKQKYSFLK
jgi:hypothetical protein